MNRIKFVSSPNLPCMKKMFYRIHIYIFYWLVISAQVLIILLLEELLGEFLCEKICFSFFKQMANIMLVPSECC